VSGWVDPQNEQEAAVKSITAGRAEPPRDHVLFVIVESRHVVRIEAARGRGRLVLKRSQLRGVSALLAGLADRSKES
jgi:hypothetical protein